MSKETQNAFAHAYQMAKLATWMNDDHWQELLNSPKPPVKVVRKVKVKSIVRDMTKDEIKIAMNQLKSLKLKRHAN